MSDLYLVDVAGMPVRVGSDLEKMHLEHVSMMLNRMGLALRIISLGGAEEPHRMAASVLEACKTRSGKI